MLFILATVVRIIYAYLYFTRYETTLFVDDWDYISYAEQILAQGIWVPDIDAIVGNGHQVGMGWPMMLSVIFALFGKNFTIVFILNGVLSGLHVVFTYLLAKLVFNKETALLSAILCLFYIRFIKFVPFVLKENLIHFGFTFCIYLFFRSLKEKSYKPLLSFTFVYLLFLHIDERYLIFSPLFAGLYIYHGRFELSATLKRGAVAASLFLLGLVPTTMRNYQVYKRPIILAFQTSEFTDFLFDERQFKNGRPSLETPYSSANFEVYETITEHLLQGEPVDQYKSTYKYIPLIKQGIREGNVPHTYNAVEGIFAEVKEFFRICRFKGGYVANGYRYMPAWPLLNNIIYIFYFGVPFVLFFTVLFKKSIWGNSLASALLFIIALYSFTHIFLIHALVRYRIPIDGFIFIFAAFTIIENLRHTRFAERFFIRKD